MIDEPSPKTETSLPDYAIRKQQSKQRSKELKRMQKGRTLSFQLLDLLLRAQTLNNLIANGQQAKRNSEKKKKNSKAITRIEIELTSLGFDLEEALSSAKKYRSEAPQSGKFAQQSSGLGASMYGLGNKLKNWK